MREFFDKNVSQKKMSSKLFQFTRWDQYEIDTILHFQVYFREWKCIDFD